MGRDAPCDDNGGASIEVKEPSRLVDFAGDLSNRKGSADLAVCFNIIDGNH